jgi:hypothetical protein
MIKKFNLFRIGFGCVCFLGLLAANSQPKLKYTPYQILAWEIKANEGFSDHWYPDGIVRGKQSYSIGFGWNDQGRRRDEAVSFLTNGKITFENATRLTCYEIDKYGRLHTDDLKNVALQLYSYSRGLTKNGSKLGGCCDSKFGCGNISKNVRYSHNRRRQFELACWNHDNQTIIEMTEGNLKKIHKIKMMIN